MTYRISFANEQGKYHAPIELDSHHNICKALRNFGCDFIYCIELMSLDTHDDPLDIFKFRWLAWNKSFHVDPAAYEEKMSSLFKDFNNERPSEFSKMCHWLSNRKTPFFFDDIPVHKQLRTHIKNIFQDLEMPVLTYSFYVPISSTKQSNIYAVCRSSSSINTKIISIASSIIYAVNSSCPDIRKNNLSLDTRDSHHEGRQPIELKSKEYEILKWIAAGKTMSETADIMDINYTTVRYHLDNARKRHGFKSVIQTVTRAALDYGFNTLTPSHDDSFAILQDSDAQ